MTKHDTMGISVLNLLGSQTEGVVAMFLTRTIVAMFLTRTILITIKTVCSKVMHELRPYKT